MAYIPNREPVNAWSRIMAKYKRHPGSWAYVLHRISGIGLTTYLFVHIWALSSLTQGRAAFAEEMKTFTTPPFKFLEWALGILVMFHAFNGIRIAIVDFGAGARRQKTLLRLAYSLTIAVVILMFFLIFNNDLFAK
ncbi:MAG TPA: succinate dehydrogenase, cytochrome b556 subunit [Candidatus Kapabacteria bacterium]|nr:succinate dehydrogenase, cytochrome b556 subunit [Candidatus Kapabacteria bacterium]